MEGFFKEDGSLRGELITTEAERKAKAFLTALPRITEQVWKKFLYELRKVEAKIEQNGFLESKTSILMLLPKAAYLVPKTYSTRKAPWEFREFIEEYVPEIKNEKDFKAFSLMVQAITGYLYGLGMRG